MEHMKPILTNKKILITGGAGFIGSHLCEKLIDKNEVTSLDNYLTGSPFNHVDGVAYLEGDVKNILSIFNDRKFDIVFHFGEYSRVEQSLSEPHLTFLNSFASFHNVLEFCRVNNSKLVYSGSSTKFSNVDDPGSLSPYTFAKKRNTELLIQYGKWYSLNYAITYFYNAYGPREISSTKYATVVAKFLKLKSEGREFAPVTYPGTQLRNFTHVFDIVSGLLLVAAQGSGDGYGIGADQAMSILDLCKEIGLKPKLKEKHSANRLDAKLNTDQIKGLGWRQEYNLTDYIRANNL